MYSNQTYHHTAECLSTCTGVLLAARQSIRDIKQKSREAPPAMSLRQAFHLVRQHKNQRLRRRAEIQTLKVGDFYQLVCSAVEEKRLFQVGELDRLLKALTVKTGLPNWSWELVGDALFHGVLIYTRYESLAPALLLRTTKAGFYLQSFHYDFTSQKLGEVA